MGYYLQDPDEKLDWQHDWSAWLGAGDSIASRQWTISPTGPTLTNDTTAAVTVTGMTRGQVYRLAEKVTTANGIIGERSVVIRAGSQ